MPTDADIRRLALSFDEVREVDHFARPAFRTKKRIFAVIRPDGLWLNLPDERKEFLFEADPKVFVKYMWGARANVIVQIAKVDRRELEALIRQAWEFNSAPARKPSVKRAAKPRR